MENRLCPKCKKRDREYFEPMHEDDDKEDEEDAIDGRRKLLRNCATGQIFLLENGATLHRSWRDDAAYARYLSSRGAS